VVGKKPGFQSPDQAIGRSTAREAAQMVEHSLNVASDRSHRVHEITIQITENGSLGLQIKKKTCRTSEGLHIPCLTARPEWAEVMQHQALAASPSKERPHGLGPRESIRDFSNGRPSNSTSAPRIMA
jgi:hypothetical protein